MKKLIILSAIAISGLMYNTADAQIRLHLGLRFGPRPVVYAPAPVVVEQAPVYTESDQAYDNSNDDYYYLPDVDAYYDVTAQCYYYNDGSNWISAAYLPGTYRDYDWRNAQRFEVRAPRPYMHDDFYRSKFNGRENTAWARGGYDNHFNNGYANRPNNWNNNREQGRYNQPIEQNRGWGGSDQHFDNRGNQPQNNNGGRDTRGGGERFGQNNQQARFADHRMSKF
jgi:hypothetical protein